MPKLSIVTLEVESSVLAGNPLGDPHVRDLPVYLPPGYNASDQRYPVIWVLAAFGSWGARMFNLQAWDENLIERADRLMADQQQIGRGARDDFAADLVGGGTHDGTPETSGEEHDEEGEEDDDEPARAGAPALGRLSGRGQ